MAEGRYSGQVLIAGTGKMAANIGLHLLDRGATVHWFSRSPARAQGARPELDRLLRRQQRVDPDFGGFERAALGWLGADGRVDGLQGLSPDHHPGLAAVSTNLSYDLIIECSAEDRAVKQRLGPWLTRLGRADSLRLSNSSSIPPDVLGPGWLGCHWFYPVGLHRLVELVLPVGNTPGEADPNLADHVRPVLENLGFRCLVQTSARAFAINRLLLPLQALAMDCLRRGWPAPTVDRLSANQYFPLPVLSGMDAIGLDLIAEAVGNYLVGPESPRRESLLGLVTGLQALIGQGKLGKKNQNGLLMGEALPWPVDPVLAPAEAENDQQALDRERRIRQLEQDFAELAALSIRQALERGDFDREELQFVLDELWGGRLP